MIGNDVLVMLAMLLYFVVVVVVGFIYAKRSNSSSEEYFLGGRGLGPWLTALSAEASDMSGWLLMGLPGIAYFTGASDAMWTAIGLIIVGIIITIGAAVLFMPAAIIGIIVVIVGIAEFAGVF